MITTRNRRLRTTLAAVTVSLVLAGTACSTSGDDDADDKTTTTTQASTTTAADDTTDDMTDDVTDDTSDDVTDDMSDDTTDDTSDDVTDDFSDMDQDQIIGQIADGLMGQESIPNLDRPTAECLAEEIVDIVGLEKLAEIGMSSGAFSGIDEASAQEFAKSWGECGYDLKGFFTKTLTDSGATAAQAECVYDAVGDEPIEELLALGFAGAADSDATADIQAQINQAVQGCR